MLGIRINLLGLGLLRRPEAWALDTQQKLFILGPTPEHHQSACHQHHLINMLFLCFVFLFVVGGGGGGGGFCFTTTSSTLGLPCSLG